MDKIKNVLQEARQVYDAAAIIASVLKKQGWTYHDEDVSPTKDYIAEVIARLIDDMRANKEIDCTRTGRLRVTRDWDLDESELVLSLELGTFEDVG